MMAEKRLAGVLLHPSSLSGGAGIGDLGKEAFRFVDFLAEAGMSLWQVLPLGPTGYGDSPYASFSSFAGNPLLISLDVLMEEGWLPRDYKKDMPTWERDSVDYGTLIPWKFALLEQAARKFMEKKAFQQEEYNHFIVNQAEWLDDYALFMAIKNEFDKKAQQEGRQGAFWSNYWPKDLALRKEKELERWRSRKAGEIQIQKIWQFWFRSQWQSLRDYAHEKNIKIIGDIPVFVAADSADVWSARELFQLDEQGQPLSVAGVPPDYFSDTGQLWGNPLYDWEAMKKNGFQWWLKRIRATLGLVDIIRVDHFRGFEAFWSVPAGDKTAENGRWIKAPGRELFETVSRELGNIPVLAEDLGLITEEVEQLRDDFCFPGMRILQFAFDAAESDNGLDPYNIFFPHNYHFRSVVYTGTHDNETMQGKLDSYTEEELSYIRKYTGYQGDDLCGEMIRQCLASVCQYAILPMQDLLGLGNESRMNTPAVLGGNWQWRMTGKEDMKSLAKKYLEMNEMYGRSTSLWKD